MIRSGTRSQCKSSSSGVTVTGVCRSRQLSKDIEDRLRARYTLIDKTDPAAIAAAQQAGMPVNDDGEMVGETDTKGFNVGPTSSSQPAPSSVVAARKKEARRGKAKDRTRYDAQGSADYTSTI